MSVTISKTNKPLNPRAKDLSPKGYNRASLYSGKALDFDGVNDQVNVTTSDVDFGANDFSVTAIANWTGANVDGKLAYAERGTTPSALASWQIRTDGAGNMKFQTNTASGGWKEVSFSGVEAILNKGLTHLTFVRIGSSVTLYINGALYGSGSGIASTLDAANGNFCIGNRIGSANYWNGLIGQYKIFNTALTAAQVSDLYNNPEKIVPDGVADSALKLWLPMMEGAGTTAYDGSGNGNHGTINGATWVSGVGSPVAQTALVSWNKGTNLLTRSEELLHSDWISQSSVTLTSGQDAPDGSTNAFKYNISSAVNRAVDQTFSFGISTYTFSIYVKAIVDTTIRILSYDGWSEDISINVADGWTRIDSSHTTSSSSSANIGFFDASGDIGDRFYIWGASLEQSSSVGSYVRTGATAQTSEVLLSQGLTANKDITGVNAFENPRNAYALNLDGTSWGEVHDNASLDITDAITLEAWVYNDGSSFDGFLGRYFTGDNNRSVMIYEISNGTARMIVSKDGINAYNANGTISGGWNHIVGTCDDTEIKIYINGVKGTDGTAPSGSIHVSSYPYEIGRYAANTGTQHTNQIALPRIYNRALTATEVARNYNADKSKFGL